MLDFRKAFKKIGVDIGQHYYNSPEVVAGAKTALASDAFVYQRVSNMGDNEASNTRWKIWGAMDAVSTQKKENYSNPNILLEKIDDFKPSTSMEEECKILLEIIKQERKLTAEDREKFQSFFKKYIKELDGVKAFNCEFSISEFEKGLKTSLVINKENIVWLPLVMLCMYHKGDYDYIFQDMQNERLTKDSDPSSQEKVAKVVLSDKEPVESTKAESDLDKYTNELLIAIRNNQELTEVQLQHLVFHQLYAEEDVALFVKDYLEKHNPKMFEIVQENVAMENYLRMLLPSQIKLQIQRKIEEEQAKTPQNADRIAVLKQALVNPQPSINPEYTVRLVKYLINNKSRYEINVINKELPDAIKADFEKELNKYKELDKYEKQLKSLGSPGLNLNSNELQNLAQYILQHKTHQQIIEILSDDDRNNPNLAKLKNYMAEEVKKELDYESATFEDGGYHLFKVRSNNSDINEKFAGMSGSKLKTHLLLHFKESLQEAVLDANRSTNPTKTYKEKVEALKASNEFKTLKKGQDNPAKKTRSVTAFEQMESGASRKVHPFALK